jgi:hypothetical protein
MKISSRYSLQTCGLHTVSVFEAKLGTRHVGILWQLLDNQEVEWAMCFDGSQFMHVDETDAVGGSEGD